LDNIYCEHCHTGFPTYPLMAYVTKLNGSLVINGCSINAGTSNYLKYACNLVNL